MISDISGISDISDLGDVSDLSDLSEVSDFTDFEYLMPLDGVVIFSNFEKLKRSLTLMVYSHSM